MNSSFSKRLGERSLAWLIRKDGIAINITRAGVAVVSNIGAFEGNATSRRELQELGGFMADYDATFSVLVRDAGTPAVGDKVVRVSDSRAFRVESIGNSLNDGTLQLNCMGVDK